MLDVRLAGRVRDLPPYLFEAIDKMKQEALGKGVDLIDMSIGDPDTPTPKHIVQAMQAAVQNPAYHSYPSSRGMLSFREAVSGWYKKRFNVSLDPATEVLSLIGSKEGVGHFPLAFVGQGDVVLVPSPGYPVYEIGTLFAGGQAHMMPLLEQNSYLPDFNAIPADVLNKARVMFLNYPNNPTAALADEKFFKQAIELASKHNIIICHDAAYTEMYYDGKKPLSFMQVDGAREVGVELHSLSKTFNMTGWRIGHAVGNPQVIAGLGKIKANLDSGAFKAVQEAGIAALNSDDSVCDELRHMYQERRDALYEGLQGIGLSAERPGATFYLWTKVPEGYDSTSFATHLLNEAGVLTTPGNGFGAPGEGYVRFALTVPVARIEEAISRIKAAL